MRDIYLQVEGKQVGPLPEDQVKQFLAQGKIQADVLAWHDGLPEWVPFANLIGLSVAPSPKRIPLEVSSVDLVQIDGVKKSFGDKIALKSVSFSVPSGQICGLLGPNGAGKTTLFRLLMGILKATEGKLLIDGKDAFEKRVEVSPSFFE